MGVFNNLVMYDQHVPQNSLKSIVPDLAKSWAWSEDGTELTSNCARVSNGMTANPSLPRTRVHLGYAARQVEREASGQSAQSLVPQPRGSHHKRRLCGHFPSEAAAAVAFSPCSLPGYSPVYPCHVSPRDMRTQPIGTGPFKFVEFKPNEPIKVATNPDYWKPDRPYLDGIEYTIIPEPSTRAFWPLSPASST